MTFVCSGLLLIFAAVEDIGYALGDIRHAVGNRRNPHACAITERSIRCVSPDGCSREWQHDPYMSTDAKIDVIRM